ncbi:mechanosensitive ion channel family protein [Rufibacter latericius]|uniref:Mechanosensitive ion channel family protein n=1 Tax=Rufibacter latericius TaxID=2487040 RepID=A0A3M9N128_9BACT|nr:mechanosensitive ion channel domain-containing protein [Rufibacter latericius]RNI31504.1 mechanosensitive ion channel family protein [Rufibacter latericius]
MNLLNELLDDLTHVVQDHLPLILQGAGVITGGLLAGGFAKWLLFRFLAAYNQRFPRFWIAGTLKHLDRPLFYFLPLLVLSTVLPLVPLRADAHEVFRRIVEIALTCAFAWTLIGCVYVVQYRIRHKYQLDKADNLKERKLYTQLQFVKKVVIITIVFFTICLILMSFPTVRKIGTGLVTSAGIAGVILGFAAQRSLGNLLAGFQIAFTQPIRIDDVLVVENEWGKVEEITLTYVVLRIWDQRRLILPLNYFIEKPFQNWSRTTVELLGTVFIYLDYSAPLEEIRKELTRILPQNHLWDGRVGILQVTDFKERTMEVRILVSASDSASAFDLRCWVREKMVTFIQQNYPESLPVTRTAGTGESSKPPFVPMEEATQ